MNEIHFDLEHLRLTGLSSGSPDQPLLLALHGWLDNAASFNELRRHLPGYRFIALDFAGHGYSDHRPDGMPYYIWDNVSELLQVVESLGEEPVTLIGHSMGASIASLFAGAFPQRVRHLHLIEGVAPLVYEPAHLPQLLAEAIQKRHKLQQKTLRPYPTREAALAARMRGRWPVSRQAAEWLIERGLLQQPQGYIWRSDPALMLPSIVRLSEPQVAAFLQAITAPVSLYLGEQGLYEPAWQRRIDQIAQPRCFHLPGNHHLHLEPEAARLIAEQIMATPV